MMNYLRVIPRDLFNEGNLLKCYGGVYINLERMGRQEELIHEDWREPFEVCQSQEDGSLTILNIFLQVRGENYYFSRPLNSRGSWPLRLVVNEDEIEVFDTDGNFSDEMKQFLEGGKGMTKPIITQEEMKEILISRGFTIGERDSRLNTDFPGTRMVVEGSIAEIERDYELPTEDGRNGPWCVVGDDEEELVKTAFDYCQDHDWS